MEASNASRSLAERGAKNSSSFRSARVANLGTMRRPAAVSAMDWKRRSSARSVRVMSFLPTRRSTSLETPPRVMPMRSARTPGETSWSSNISRITTHSATVTPLAWSLRAKDWETWLETKRSQNPTCVFRSLTGREDALASFMNIRFHGNSLHVNYNFELRYCPLCGWGC